MSRRRLQGWWGLGGSTQYYNRFLVQKRIRVTSVAQPTAAPLPPSNRGAVLQRRAQARGRRSPPAPPPPSTLLHPPASHQPSHVARAKASRLFCFALLCFALLCALLCFALLCFVYFICSGACASAPSASASSFFLVGICLLQRLMYMPQRNFPSARKWSEGCLRLPLLQQLPREHIAPVRNRPQPPERRILVLKQGVMRRKGRLSTRAPRSGRPPGRCRCRRTARCTT
jgi:hypothetical protein